MCMSSSNSATNAATAQANAQQANVTQNVGAINSAFAGRQQQYDQYLGALQSSYRTQLAQQGAQAGRQLKFSLARGGLTGSSVAADQGGELQRELGQGQVTAEEQAQAKLAGLQSSDVAEKQQMISLAESGANIGNAAQQTATALQANLNNAQTNLGPNSLGSVFGGITNTTNAMNTAYQSRLGLRAAQAYANPFSNATSTSGGFGGSGGAI
jgi:hypothetical protein